MILISFTEDNQLGIIKIDGNHIQYGKIFQGNLMFMSVDKLKFKYNGIIKEFPDLKDKQEYEAQLIAHERFKEKIIGMRNEDEVYEYVLSELKKFGCVPQYKQKKGFRKEKIN